MTRRYRSKQPVQRAVYSPATTTRPLNESYTPPGSCRFPASAVLLCIGVLVVLVLANALLYVGFGLDLLRAPFVLRILAIIAMALPLGLLVGVPFPSGLRLAGAWLPRAVPALCGLNAMAQCSS
jgi:hypothetical protein